MVFISNKKLTKGGREVVDTGEFEWVIRERWENRIFLLINCPGSHHFDKGPSEVQVTSEQSPSGDNYVVWLNFRLSKGRLHPHMEYFLPSIEFGSSLPPPPPATPPTQPSTIPHLLLNSNFQRT